MTGKIDKEIKIVDDSICRHIDQLNKDNRGEISQDILKSLRDFVENIMLKAYADGKDIDVSWDNIKYAVSYSKTRSELKTLRQFHKFLQMAVSHYMPSAENSERLMLKYYEYLLKIKNFLCEKYSMNVLANLDKFPLKTDYAQQTYYEKIVSEIESCDKQKFDRFDKFYIKKIKQFFVNHKVYYEVSFTFANDYANKSSSMIAFTNLDITDFYAVKLFIVNARINVLEKTMPINIITRWEVAIRDCEFKNYSRIILDSPMSISSEHMEQKNLCKFLTDTGFNLVDIIDFSDVDFKNVKTYVTDKAKKIAFFEVLERCREIIKSNKSGSNLLRYLLYHMNNMMIKDQRFNSQNTYLSNLYLDNKCIPFDNMPFYFSLKGHNPKLEDLFYCIDSSNRQHEILARFIRTKTENQKQLFTPISELIEFNDIKKLIKIYNSKLWAGHIETCKLVIKNDYVFINGYVMDTCTIISKLKKLSSEGIKNYSSSVKFWLGEPGNNIDCDEKKEVLSQIFSDSSVSLIYGAAGTGKSTFINHVAHFFADSKKLFLAYTNPAVDNLKRRVKAPNCTFSTITKFIKKKDIATDYNLLIVDECSTISNEDMRKIIEKVQYKLLLLVGDPYQISSIRFGNWFSIANNFVSKNSIYELTKPYRSTNTNLIEYWNNVRNIDDAILEKSIRGDYSAKLDKSIFESSGSDEIILCLNYDGFYGINNINRLLQENNNNSAVQWGLHQYKVNDPILFDEFGYSKSAIIYNNLKGRISGVEILDREKITERIQFDIELDKVINGVDVLSLGQSFTLLDNKEPSNEIQNSVIRFCVHKTKSADEDNDTSSSTDIIPFHIAYAVSIHKAQGLEYDSVKVVITNEVDELITHNIFYTAITRAKNKLKIYWSPEVEHTVLSCIASMSKKLSNKRDACLLKSYLQQVPLTDKEVAGRDINSAKSI